MIAVSLALVAASIIVVVGIVDDRWGLDALTKFVGQVTAAGVLVVMGVSWIVVYDPFSASTLVLDQLQGGLITVAVAAVMINAMNFVDGLDGLAAGLGLIAALAICVFSVGFLLDQGGDLLDQLAHLGDLVAADERERADGDLAAELVRCGRSVREISGNRTVDVPR